MQTEPGATTCRAARRFVIARHSRRRDPDGRTVTTQLTIPAAASLIGFQFRQQVAPFETNLAGAITAITSTNALLLTIGSF